ncbi:MAG: 50S ribosomal protein L1 [Candidatus Geothermarchaeota archaeon]
MATEIDKKLLIELIEKAKAVSKPRNFTQAVDMQIAIEGLDLKKPENRIRLTVKLPHQSELKKIAFFGEGELASKALEAGAVVFSEKSIESLAGSKKELKKIAKEYTFFLVEPKLLSKVSKIMGPVLGPRGKVPQVVPPNVDVKSLIGELKNSVYIYVKNIPTISVKIGDEKMNSEELAENALAVIRAVESKLPEKAYIRNIYIKLTMGPPVKLSLGKLGRR